MPPTTNNNLISQEATKTSRPPVVAVMGHIDHGKSTLLDYIRKTNVVSGEAGGITQHLSAYEVAHTTAEGAVKKITFLDTPGHEAFAAMRSRGAGVADVAILVVSAEDGAQAQTLEAVKSVHAAHIPYVVAISKIDKPQADVLRAKKSLSEKGVYVEGYGGAVPAVPISAKTGEGVSELLDVVILAGELEGLSGDLAKNASGVIVEAEVDEKRGISATLIIKDGTLRKGMYIVSEGNYAPTRLMEDFLGNAISETSFSSPMRIVGFDYLPTVGARFTSYNSRGEAQDATEQYREQTNSKMPLKTENKKGFGTPASPAEQEEDVPPVLVPIIVKADVAGVVEAVSHEIEKIRIERIIPKIVGSGVGAITENDAQLAGDGGVIVGFNVKIERVAQEAALRLGTKIAAFDIIYKLMEWLQKELQSRAPKIKKEELRGRARILKVFAKSKDKQIIGGETIEGKLSRGHEIKIVRRGNDLGRGKILGLEKSKVKTDNVEAGSQFGMEAQSKIEIAAGDILEDFEVVTI